MLYFLLIINRTKHLFHFFFFFFFFLEKIIKVKTLNQNMHIIYNK